MRAISTEARAVDGTDVPGEHHELVARRGVPNAPAVSSKDAVMTLEPSGLNAALSTGPR